MRKYIAIIIASLALFTGQAHAQRCLPKMQGIEVRADMADGFNLGGKDGGPKMWKRVFNLLRHLLIVNFTTSGRR